MRGFSFFRRERRLWFEDQRYRVSFDPLFASDETEAFGGGRLDRYGFRSDSHRGGQRFAHGWNVRFDFGTLQTERAVDIPDCVALPSDQFHGTAQQDLAVDAFVRFGSIRKMQSDVADRGGSEQRVAQRMDQYVSVRVGDAAEGVFDTYASQPQREPLR